jgi:glycosyltransferase involved in cell wall biosynthesis
VEVLVACGSVEREMPGVEVVLESMRFGGRKVPYRAVGRDRATTVHDRRVARIVSDGTVDVDVVHAWPSGAERTLAAARARGIPAFLERPNAHTAFAMDVVRRECERIGMRLDARSPHAFHAGKLAREAREFAAADALLCPSDFVARTHAARGEREARILRHRYGFDPRRFSAPGRDRNSRGFVVAFVGRLEPRKGVHLALEAWRRARLGDRGRLVLCGAMEPGYEGVLAPLLDQSGVELHGHVGDPARILRGADALVLPSLEEGSALVTYEARACGAVLAVSDRAGACARHGVDALVHPAGDVDALAAHLRRLADEPGLLAALRAASLAGTGDLTWDAAAGALLSAYAEGAARVRATRPDDPRAVVITSSANPHTTGSVPQIGYRVAKGISERTTGTLIFHAADRDLVADAFPKERLRFAGSRLLSRTMRRVSMRLFPGRWNLISMVEFVDYALFDLHAYAIARRLVGGQRIDYVLRVNPISLRFPSVLARLPVPVFTGPHNGGMEWPPGFSFLDEKERTGERFRFLGDLLHRVYGDFGGYAGIFVANTMCAATVPERHRDKLVLFPENGVDGVTATSPHAGDATRLLYVGRLTAFKNVDAIIRALTRLPERVRLTIVGDGPQREELQALARALGVGHRCVFAGQRAHDELDAFYSQAGVFVFPSVRESGGAVVLEAMSHGLPCVVAAWGGPPTYTGSGGVHLRVDSPQALEHDLVHALERFLEAPEEARGLGERAKRVITGEYVWDAKAERLHAAMLDRLP